MVQTEKELRQRVLQGDPPRVQRWRGVFGKVDSLKAIPNFLLVDHLTSLITIEGAEINKFGGINYVERI